MLKIFVNKRNVARKRIKEKLVNVEPMLHTKKCHRPNVRRPFFRDEHSTHLVHEGFRKLGVGSSSRSRSKGIGNSQESEKGGDDSHC